VLISGRPKNVSGSGVDHVCCRGSVGKRKREHEGEEKEGEGGREKEGERGRRREKNEKEGDE
jgi:hypothetical protein